TRSRRQKRKHILPSLNGKTARPWRDTLPFKRLAREGRMTVTIGRRELLAALGGAAVARPVPAGGQQGERVRRIGVLVHGSQTGAVWQQRLAAFRDGLEELGWQEGRNVHIVTLFSDNNYDRLPQVAQELVALSPEVIFANTTPATKALQKET